MRMHTKNAFVIESLCYPRPPFVELQWREQLRNEPPSNRKRHTDQREGSAVRSFSFGPSSPRSAPLRPATLLLRGSSVNLDSWGRKQRGSRSGDAQMEAPS